MLPEIVRLKFLSALKPSSASAATGAGTSSASARPCTHILRVQKEEKGGTAKGQKATAARAMAGRAMAEKVMEARDMAAKAEATRVGAKAKVRRAEAKEFMG